MSDIHPQQDSSPGLVGRAKAILTTPKTEWPKIAAEPESVREAFIRYAMPLAAIGPIAGFIGGQLFGVNAILVTYRPTLMAGLSTAIVGYVLGLASIFLIAWVANFIASKFGGQENYRQAFRLCAYAFTAGWVAAVVQIVPSLALLALLGSLYGLYLFYLGATPMMAVPQDKAAGYTAVTIIAAIIAYIVVGALAAAITAPFGAAAGASARADQGTVEMNLGEYGNLKVETDGDTQTMEIPGVGKVRVTQDGETVKVEGEDFKAEVQDAASDAE